VQEEEVEMEEELAEKVLPEENLVQGVDDMDAAYLDLRGDWEMQAYNFLKRRAFFHTPMYDPNLLAKIGMDTEFTSIFKACGWANIVPLDERGSHHLTIQFLCTLLETDEGISFWLFGKEYDLEWKILASYLGSIGDVQSKPTMPFLITIEINFGGKFWGNL
jgi:hypothetical protein